MYSYKEIGLVNTKDMFAKAMAGKYAIPAYNFNNMEQLQAIIQACVETESPLILQVSKGARAYANHTYLIKLVEAAVEETGLPIALHLDHGDTFELCKSCIDGGFTSVMIDGSKYSFEENIELTPDGVILISESGSILEYTGGNEYTFIDENGEVYEKTILDNFFNCGSLRI